VDGRAADWAGNQEWWCLQVDGEDAMVGASQIVLEEGKAYSLILKVGY